MPYAHRVKMTSVFRIGLSLLALASCKPEEKVAEAPASPSAPSSSAPALGQTSALAPSAPARGHRTASEAERVLAEVFIERFLTAIEADDSATWPSLHTLEQREDLAAKNAVQISYEAWRKGTLSVVSAIRGGAFALHKRGNAFTLRFEGVKVPNDPEAEYSMTVVIEDGEMRIGEK